MKGKVFEILLTIIMVCALLVLVYKFFFEWVINNLGIGGLKVLLYVSVFVGFLALWIIYKDKVLARPKKYKDNLLNKLKDILHLIKKNTIKIISSLFSFVTPFIIPAIIIFGLFLFFGNLFDGGSSGGNSYDRDYSYGSYDYEHDYDYGYDWASDNGINDFDDCDYKFGYGTEAEDGCNEYVQDNEYYGNTTFYGYDCTEDCSGHEAGYEWAENNGITDPWDCGGNSYSFIEGCEAYTEEYGW